MALDLDRLARWSPPLLLVGYLGYSVAETATRLPWNITVVTVLCALGYLPLHLLHVRAEPSRPRAMTLPAQVVLTYLPLALGAEWAGVGGLLAGALAVSLARPWGPVLCGTTMLAQAALVLVLRLDLLVLGDVVALGFGSVALAVLPVIADELRANRSAIADLAASRERLRIARDLHDTLGHGLTAVALKGELATILLRRKDKRALVEIEELTKVALDTLESLPHLGDTGRELDLDEEIASAAALLRSAGVRCTVAHVDTTPPEVSDVFAWAVREGVTNILRHSHAMSCSISVTVHKGQHRLDVVNDGVLARAEREGVGLAGLSERTAALGGSVSASRGAGGQFTLSVTVPARSSS
ncbi:sensor histidine kinase [Allokutzneria oryzae]|uniref:Sensor histidine kinase n=1 Tax=Allokutzneria oryzae TaxID=1378989 RepID=A0ABV5ZYR3_9PSEU